MEAKYTTAVLLLAASLAVTQVASLSFPVTDLTERAGAPKQRVATAVFAGAGALYTLFFTKSGSSQAAHEQARTERIRCAISGLPTPKDATDETIFGNINCIHTLLYRWCKEMSVPAFRIEVMGRPVIVTDNRDIMATITSQRPTNFRRPADQNEMTSGLQIDGIFNAEGDKWRLHRKATARSFNMPSVRKLFPAIVEVFERLDARWQRAAASDGIVKDFKTEMAHTTMEIIFATAFGLRLPLLAENAEQEEELKGNQEKAHLFYMTFEAFWHRFLHWGNKTWLTAQATETDKIHNKNQQDLHDFVYNIVTAAYESGEGEMMPCMLKSMVDSHGDAKKALSHEELIGNAITFANAGHEMSLPKNAGVLAQLRQEARDVLGDDFSGLTAEAVEKRLPLCEAAFKEAMRLHPVAPMFAFEANVEGVTIPNGMALPEGTQIWCVFTSNGFREECFSKPSEFRLDRWIPELREAAGDLPNHEAGSIMPFGAGPRICAGMRLAYAEAVAGIAVMARRFKFELQCEAEEVGEVMNLTVAPKKLPIRVALA